MSSKFAKPRPKFYLIACFVEARNKRNPELLEIRRCYLTKAKLASSIGAWCEHTMDAARFRLRQDAVKFCSDYEEKFEQRLIPIPVYWVQVNTQTQIFPPPAPYDNLVSLPKFEGSIEN